MNLWCEGKLHVCIQYSTYVSCHRHVFVQSPIYATLHEHVVTAAALFQVHSTTALNDS